MEKALPVKSRRRSLRQLKYAALFASITIALYAIIGSQYFTDKRMKDSQLDNAPLITFLYNGGIYSLWPKNYLERIGFIKPVTKADLGDKLFVFDNDSIQDMPKDRGYAGSSVYEYKPIDSRAVLVVEKNGQYELFGFCNFATGAGEVNKNDGANILAVYNLNSPGQIKNIEILPPSDKSISPKTVKTITDPQFISRFLKEYQEMPEASSDFYDAISQLEGPEKSIDAGTEILYLRGAKRIVVHLNNGLFLNFSFYPALGYIDGYTAAYKLPEDLFAELLEMSK